MTYRSKYHSRKTKRNGITYDSQKEAHRHAELMMLERCGMISELQTQVKFVLIPAQYGDVFDPYRRRTMRKCIERECSYIADFVYKENGQTVVEDVKGYRTTEYIIKRKMMLYLRGIRIKEV